MKKVFLMLMLFAPMVAFAQKFGHVDTQAIIQSLPEFARANGEIEAVGKQYENELKASQERNIEAINSIVGEIDKLTKRMDEINEVIKLLYGITSQYQN